MMMNVSPQVEVTSAAPKAAKKELAYLKTLAEDIGMGFAPQEHLPPLAKIWPVYVRSEVWAAPDARKDLRLHLVHTWIPADGPVAVAGRDEAVVMLAGAEPLTGPRRGEATTSFQLTFSSATRLYSLRQVLATDTAAAEVADRVKRQMGLTGAEIENGLDQAAGRAFALGIFRLSLPKRVRQGRGGAK